MQNAIDFYHLLKILVHMELKLLKVWAIKIVKNFLIVLKKFMADAIESDSKRVIQKTAEATGDLIGKKIADKTTSISKSPKELHSQNNSKELHSKTDEHEIEMPKERYICPEKKQQTIDELRLV